jgi:hypothetical protein
LWIETAGSLTPCRKTKIKEIKKTHPIVLIADPI